MNEMIKAERNKICSRKQTRMLFLAGVVLIVAYFFFFQFTCHLQEAPKLLIN